MDMQNGQVGCDKLNVRTRPFDGAAGTPLISLGPAQVVNSLCPEQEKRTMREPEVQIVNSV